ncbi:MAG: 3-hydroxy-3-methylglutaryl CoA synthase [Chloroflexi bacterium]|nr:MAG: 3-hydroxy-3-methylglutaryl CoA synthase [Chloroflexota bacterium]
MAGIISYGAYIPLHRMDRAEFYRAWGGFAIPGETAVASYDEDTITMAMEASSDCLKGMDRESIDAVFFATTTSPYKERLGASILAAALDLPPATRTMDVTGTLRAGTTAIAAALDTINAGSAKRVLVAIADCRLGAPSGDAEQLLGSGAAAVLLGKDNVIVEIEESSHITDEFSGVWRTDSDVFVRSWEDRMVSDKGYSALLSEAISALMQKSRLGPDAFDRVVFDAPTNVMRHAAVARKLKFDAAKLQDPMVLSLGNTGAALATMMLVAALEEAKAGQRLLFASYGNGADAFVLRTTPALEKLGARRGIKKHLESKRMLTNYETYLRWRGIIPLEAARRPEQSPTSLSSLWRNRREILALYGARCLNCGTIQYVNPSANFTTGVTPIRICAACQSKDRFEPYRFADKKATVFTFTQDNLAASMDPPATVTVVDFDGGGRGVFDMTDRDPAKLEVGMRVEMTFRRLYSDRGIHNYYWKTRPIRCEEN